MSGLSVLQGKAIYLMTGIGFALDLHNRIRGVAWTKNWKQ